MKIINKTKDKKLGPVTIEVTFETKQEMSAIWHRLNMGHALAAIVEHDKCPFGLKCGKDLAYPLWNGLDDIMERM